MARDRLGLEPLLGHRSSSGPAAGGLEILVWEHSGFWVLYKRLERGTFARPAEDTGAPFKMRGTGPMLLLSGIDLSSTRRRRWYERAA